MAFFGGCSLIMTIIALFFLFTPPSDDNTVENDYIRHSTSVIRLAFFFIYVIFACGYCTKIFVQYDINYLYIFELDPQSKMTHHQLYKVGFILLFVWSACFSLSLMEVRLEYLFPRQPMWFMLVMAIFFVLYCFQPFIKCGYRTARF